MENTVGDWIPDTQTLGVGDRHFADDERCTLSLQSLVTIVLIIHTTHLCVLHTSH